MQTAFQSFKLMNTQLGKRLVLCLTKTVLCSKSDSHRKPIKKCTLMPHGATMQGNLRSSDWLTGLQPWLHCTVLVRQFALVSLL
ncbi:unnamed protein product [Ixodes hexagonus]